MAELNENSFNHSDDSLLHDFTKLSDDLPSEASDSNSYTSDSPLISVSINENKPSLECYTPVNNDIHGIDTTNNMDDLPSEASDSNSYTSDTPLISILTNENDPNKMYYNPEMSALDMDNHLDSPEDKQLDGRSLSHLEYQRQTSVNTGYSRQTSVNTGYSRQTSVNTGHSVININDFLDGVEEVQVDIQPLNIIGGGWECGSVSSLYHMAASREGFRSRLGTFEKQSNQGSIAFLPQNRLLSRVFANSVSSFQFSKKGSVIDDLNKSIIPAAEDPDLILQEDETDVEKPRNFKNLCVVSIGLTILYFAIGGLRNLQSSLNSDGGVGVISLAATFASFTLSSLISPFIVQMYRPKLCLILGFLSHIFYVMANYSPKLLYFIPSSVILGAGNALTWNAACTYITELGINEADHKKTFPSHILSQYFGFFFLTYQASTVFGNLISSLILIPKNHVVNQLNISLFNNSDLEITESNNSYGQVTITSSMPVCGAGFSNTNVNGSSPLVVDEFDKLFLLGTYATCVIIAVLTIVVFLDHLPHYTSKSASVREVLGQAKEVVLMTFNKKFMFIIVLCLYTVLGNGFVIADTLKAYVTCPLGIYMVGYTMICFGVCGSISSFIFGRLQQYTGRVPIFLVATLINVVSLVIMVTWHPVAADINYIFVLLGAWGFADGIWQSQTISLISSVFGDQYETALGCCRFLQGIAGIIVFLLSDMLGMKTKITIVLGTCLMAFILYMIMEVTLRWKKQKNVEVVKDTKCIEIEVELGD